MSGADSGAGGLPLHVVFGATGGIGRAVTEELVRRGRRVRAISRGGAAIGGAEGMAADATQPDSAATAAAGAAVVYPCVNPGYTRWPELLPPGQPIDPRGGGGERGEARVRRRRLRLWPRRGAAARGSSRDSNRSQGADPRRGGRGDAGGAP
jgi:hypothetical protein